MLGISAGHAGEDIVHDSDTETYCDKVAVDFLIPADEISQMWKGDFKEMALRFKVSEIVIARRVRDLNMISDEDYKCFWTMYGNRQKKYKKPRGGGDFYRTSVKRVGRLFAIHVRNAVNSRQLNYTDAYRLTGLYGDTFQKFMRNNI